jgi:hypothetical protein
MKTWRPIFFFLKKNDDLYMLVFKTYANSPPPPKKKNQMINAKYYTHFIGLLWRYPSALGLAIVKK